MNSDEIPLEDIDKILEEDDPGFNESLAEVKAQADENTADIEIESIAIDEANLENDSEDPEPSKLEKILQKIPLLAKLKRWRPSFRIDFKGVVDKLLVWLKHRPKEYLGFLLSQLKAGFGVIGRGLTTYKKWPLSKKLALVFLFVVGVSAFVLLKLNLGGKWIPVIDRPLLNDFNSVADKVVKLEDPEWTPLFQALRQPEHRYLFDKVVVNLKRNEYDPDSNPMGLFEFYVELDSRDTAVEVKSRELELSDLIQRTIEGETHNSLTGEPGKQRLKNLIRQELNQVLNQGWVKDVYISNMVLKP